MTRHSSTRRYRKASGRRVWVFSELNHQLQPEQIARIIAVAGLERARREAKASAASLAATQDVAPPDASGKGDDHV